MAEPKVYTKKYLSIIHCQLHLSAYIILENSVLVSESKRFLLGIGKKIPQHIMQNTTIFIVFHLNVRIQPA